MNPVTGFAYAVDGSLTLRGSVRRADGSPASGALVEVWHADPFGIAPFGGWTPLARAHAAAGTLPAEDHYSEARDSSGCHAIVKTDAAGAFEVATVDPGAYGPPQHVELRITGRHVAPLYTKVYLADDPHLEYLARRNFASLRTDRRVVLPEAGRTLGPDARFEADGGTYVLGDLQNRTLRLNVTLDAAPADVVDFDGTWTDGVGGQGHASRASMGLPS